ncbi:MAG: sigma-70 family RNA polymerase sigma factor [Desulfobacteraceae bacterium]
MREKTIQFDEVYSEYHIPLVRFLARMVSPHEAEDLAQEVFSKIAKSLDKFEGRAKLSTWIYRIATNTALDRLRRSKSPRVEIPLMEEIDRPQSLDGPAAISDDSPLSSVIDSEMNACIRQQVDKLPEKYRTVMALSSMEELQNREIADILEISLEAVKMRLHRGRAMLKEILENECRFYHNAESGALACDRKLPDES